MGRRAYVGIKTIAEDWIRNDEEKKEWVSIVCSKCKGSGSQSNGAVLLYNCPTCNGTCLEWKEVKYGTNN